MVVFKCRFCKELIQATDEKIGTSMKCAHCGNIVTVPPKERAAGNPQDSTKIASANNPVLPQKPPASNVFQAAPRNHGPAPQIPQGGMLPEMSTTTHAFTIEQEAQGWKSLLHFIYAVLLTGVAYGIFLAMDQLAGDQISIQEKFLHRGWIPYICIFFTMLSFAMLAGRFRMIQRRWGSLREAFIPPDAAFHTDHDLDNLIARTRSISKKIKDTLIGARIRRALEHFRATRNVMEVSQVLQEEADMAYAASQSSYSLVRVFLWAIPIFGFIGTVIGVGEAVGGFAQFLASAHEIDQIRSALGNVTSGLGVAFDTTFVGLVLSVVVMMLMSYVEKTEKDQLLAAENYCLNNLVRRLPAVSEKSEQRDLVLIVRDILQEIIPSMDTWQNEAKQLSRDLARALHKNWQQTSEKWFEGVEAIQKSVAESADRQNNALEQAASEYAAIKEDSMRLLSQIHKLFKRHKDDEMSILDAAKENFQQLLDSEQSSVQKLLDEQGALIQHVADRHRDTVDQYSRLLVDVSEKLGQLVTMQNRLETQLLEAAGSENLASVLEDVKQVLAATQPILDELASKPIDVQVKLIPA